EQVARSVGSVVLALKELAISARPAPWNAPVTTHRRWVSADVSFDEVRAIRRRTDATVNDIVLALCAGALRDYLLFHGEEVKGRTLKAMVPVSQRHEDGHGGTLGNKVSLIVAGLPIGEDDPAARLREIHQQTTELKASALADGVETMVNAAGEFTLLAAPMARLLTHSIPMNLVITNIPGPREPLFVRGAEVQRAYPYVEVIDNEGLTIAVLSYVDHLLFGLTSDRDLMPDLHLIAEGIEKGVQRLADALSDDC
ncbi:MAG TPA: WS/DGAT domain-containing protein, partial [Acidimicrobiales bacterium]